MAAPRQPIAASSVQLNQIPITALAGVHRASAPPTQVSAGSEDIVQALVVEEPVLRAVVKPPKRRAPRTQPDILRIRRARGAAIPIRSRKWAPSGAMIRGWLASLTGMNYK